jgi:hypothetical protein
LQTQSTWQVRVNLSAGRMQRQTGWKHFACTTASAGYVHSMLACSAHCRRTAQSGNYSKLRLE